MGVPPRPGRPLPQAPKLSSQEPPVLLSFDGRSEAIETRLIQCEWL